ncbi:uroplakin-3b-like protein 1 [Apus apus]|uniref:uroplakin-3b-like protein 1 n=1 Tax=Apus apus TaxID=8895 RepID=UPI0021F84413|nr:uroplakin-3b-like protein 1 [Apus apus]
MSGQFSAGLASGRWGGADAPRGNKPDLFATGRGWRRNVGGWWPRVGPAGTPSPAARTPALGTRAPATMFLPFLLLLATAHGLVHVSYTPTLADSLMGRITASTFALNQPRCIFRSLENDTNIIIWLVVATPEATANFSNSLQAGNPAGAYQAFPSPTTAYMTLGTSILQYPCQNSSGDITVLRVGSETSCANNPGRPTCNGPLPGPGPYKVKFLAFNRSEPVAETDWSDLITLNKADPYSSTSTMEGRHSGGMIAITTILSILLAVLLAGLVAMLIFGSSDSCSGSSTFTKPEMVTVRKYNTHHVYDQPAARL